MVLFIDIYNNAWKCMKTMNLPIINLVLDSSYFANLEGVGRRMVDLAIRKDQLHWGLFGSCLVIMALAWWFPVRLELLLVGEIWRDLNLAHNKNIHNCHTFSSFVMCANKLEIHFFAWRLFFWCRIFFPFL